MVTAKLPEGIQTSLKSSLPFEAGIKRSKCNLYTFHTLWTAEEPKRLSSFRRIVNGEAEICRLEFQKLFTRELKERNINLEKTALQNEPKLTCLIVSFFLDLFCVSGFCCVILSCIPPPPHTHTSYSVHLWKTKSFKKNLLVLYTLLYFAKQSSSN